MRGGHATSSRDVLHREPDCTTTTSSPDTDGPPAPYSPGLNVLAPPVDDACRFSPTRQLVGAATDGIAAYQDCQQRMLERLSHSDPDGFASFLKVYME